MRFTVGVGVPLTDLYKDFSGLVSLLYGDDVGEDLGYKARRVLNAIEIPKYYYKDSLYTLAHLFVSQRKTFYKLIKAWNKWFSVTGCSECRYFYDSEYSDENVFQRNLLGYLFYRFYVQDAKALNKDIGGFLSVPFDALNVMTTRRFRSHPNVPLMPLSCFHLGLPADHYLRAVDVFDIYTSRILKGVQGDTLPMYVTSDSFLTLTDLFVDAGVDVSLVLRWQIARAIVVNLSVYDVVNLASVGVDVLDVLERWSYGIDINTVVISFLEDIDITLLCDAVGDDLFQRRCPSRFVGFVA